MKRCLKCNQTYSDATLNFCLNDGEMLVDIHGDEPPTIIGGAGRSSSSFDDSPPTVMMNQTRVTNPTGWQPQQPGGPMAQWGSAPAPVIIPRQFGMMPRSLDQTVPTIALVLGIASIPLVCCYGGIWLGLPAMVVGYFGMRNADSKPSIYGGRGLAIAGMIMGGVTLLLSTIHIIFLLISLIAGRF